MPTRTGLPHGPQVHGRAGSVRPRPRPWTSYVAVGDSFTEGMSDPDPVAPDGYRGWADRLAALLAPHAEGLTYANLAVRGRKLDDVAGAQVDAALALAPELVSIVGGGNDILRPRADVDALAARLEGAVARLRASGADVLMATPADPAGAPLVGLTRGRVATYSAHIWSIAQRHGCYVLNQWTCDFLQDWRMWAEDRIHMTPEGHRRVALAAYAALGHDPDEADWSVPLPPADAVGRLETARGHAAWARGHLAPWVRRRLTGRSSGDGLEAKRPTLAPPDRPATRSAHPDPDRPATRSAHPDPRSPDGGPRHDTDPGGPS